MTRRTHLEKRESVTGNMIGATLKENYIGDANCGHRVTVGLAGETYWLWQ
jgi:hypothetical protein